MSQQCQVDVKFYLPPPELRRFFTTFYHVDAIVAGTATDILMPEWANLRFYAGSLPDAETLSGTRLSGSPFPVTGPSSHAVRFTMGSSRMWGIGLLPLGWAKFVRAPAGDFADALLDGRSHPAFAAFRPLADSLFSGSDDREAELARIVGYFTNRADERAIDEVRIMAIHAALVDPETATVAQIVERAGISQRTVERICRRSFGFSPKLLLRRQRFMRSIAHFLLDPSLKWIGAIDGNYHDQAQFVRDCHRFLGMTPSHYAALDKPLIGAIMRERDRMAGSAVQALDGPEGPPRKR